MWEFLKAFVAALSDGDLGATLLVALGGCALFAGMVLQREADRADFAAVFERRSRGGLYGRCVTWALDRLDRALTPDNMASTPDKASGGNLLGSFSGFFTLRAPTPEAASASGRSPFGWHLFEWALRMAIAYPIILMFAAWLTTGEPGRVGSLELFPLEGSSWLRALAFACVASFFAAIILKDERLQVGFLIAGATLASLGSVAVVGEIGYMFAGPGLVAVAGAIALATAAQGAGAILIAASIALTSSASRAITDRNIFHSEGLIAVLAISIIVVTFALLVVNAFSHAVRTGRVRQGYGGLLAALAAVTCVAAAVCPPTDTAMGGDAASLIVFLGVLSLANALFDYLSIGATRQLLRWGRSSPAAAYFCGLGDLAAAVILFTGLGATTVAALQGLNAIHAAAGNAAPLLDLGALFAALRDPDRVWDYWWLFMAFFSTMLPTLAHFGLSCYAAVAWLPFRSRLAVAIARIDTAQERARDYSAAFLGLTGYFALYLVLPSGALAFAALEIAPEIAAYLADWYLRVFEGIARLLGAAVAVPPPPEPPDLMWI